MCADAGRNIVDRVFVAAQPEAVARQRGDFTSESR
jgi:hypothetical protein